MPSKNNSIGKIHVVVLAWNHFEDTQECLRSFQASEEVELAITVVDNGSTDGTGEKISSEFPQVNIFRSEKNLGVSGGYNLGIECAMKAGAKYILIANNDIAVHPGMVKHLTQYLVRNPKVGIGMPKIYHYYGDRTRIWTIGARWRRFPPTVKMLAYNKIDQQKYTIAQKVEYAPSCCYLLRREVVEAVGLFDDNYFFYFDDWDYSARVNRAGYSIWFVPEAILWHKVSLSTQKSDRPFQWWLYMGRSAFRFYSKYCSNMQLASFAGWFFIRETIKLKPMHSVAFIKGVIQEARHTRDLQKAWR